MDRCGLLSVHFLLSTSVLTFRLLDDVVPLVVVGLEVRILVEDLGREEDVVVHDFVREASNGMTVDGS